MANVDLYNFPLGWSGWVYGRVNWQPGVAKANPKRATEFAERRSK